MVSSESNSSRTAKLSPLSMAAPLKNDVPAGSVWPSVGVDYHAVEITLADLRWLKMDMDKVVTRSDLLDRVDVSKVRRLHAEVRPHE